MIYTIDNLKLVKNFSCLVGRDFTGVVKDYDGNIAYYENGKFHRTDGPAVIWANGSKDWYINGGFHREDGPAVEYFNGIKAWWINNKRHRIDGPAIEYPDGKKDWYYNGECYGNDDDFTVESWKRKLNLMIFL